MTQKKMIFLNTVWPTVFFRLQRKLIMLKRTFEAGPGSFRPELLVFQSATQLLGLVDGLPVFAEGPPFASFYLW